MEAVVLRMQQIDKKFPGVHALDSVTIEVKAGEAVGLIGANGAGKSTLMNVLAGIEEKDSGEIYINGQKAEIHSPGDATKLGISFVHQEMTMLPTLTIAENMFISTFPKKNGLIDYKKANHMCSETLKTLGFYFSPDTRVNQLSPGDKQIVEIARALLCEPKIVIFDEPTSSLTAREKQRLFEIIKILKTRKVAIIYITHFIEEVFKVCERAYILRNGQVVGEGLIQDFTYQSIVETMIGTKEVKEYLSHKASNIGKVLLKVENLNREGILTDINFELHEGEVLGVWGLLGSGRTELLRAVTGLDQIDSGEIFIFDKGTKISVKPNESNKWIGMITENRREEGLLLPKSVIDNLSLANLKNMIKVWPLVDKKNENKLANMLIKKLNIVVSGLNQKVATLSGGNQQKVVVARWLERNPKIFFMDEPTRGLDVGAKTEIKEIIHELAKSGASVLVVSSEIEEILSLSDRYLIMSRGHIVEKLPGNATKEQLITLSAGKMNNQIEERQLA